MSRVSTGDGAHLRGKLPALLCSVALLEEQARPTLNLIGPLKPRPGGHASPQGLALSENECREFHVSTGFL